MNKIKIGILIIFTASCADSEYEPDKFPRLAELSAEIQEVNQTTHMTKVTFTGKLADGPDSPDKIVLVWGDFGYDPLKYNDKQSATRLASGEFEATIDVFYYQTIAVAFHFETEKAGYYSPTYEYDIKHDSLKIVSPVKYSN